MTSPTGVLQSRHANSKKSRRRTNLFLSVGIVVVLIAGVTAWDTNNYLWRLPASYKNPHPRALVMDQLSLNYPDPSFTTNITEALNSAGYTVIYSGPSSTAVDSFRQLPEQGYDLIIIRAHTGSSQSIITAQPYLQSEYVADQIAGRLVPAQVNGGPIYFAITPKFVTQDMTGRFSESTIMVMGCSALEGTHEISSAFLDRGASFFVGWDSSVSIIHTDTSTVAFVRLLSGGKSLPEATALAGGVDPVYGAKLQYLDWNSLVQSRTSDLVSRLVIWGSLASILVIGPMAVFAGPKLFASLDQIRERVTTRGKKKRPNRRTSNPEKRQ